MKKPLYKFRQRYDHLKFRVILIPSIVIFIAYGVNALISYLDIQYELNTGNYIRGVLTACAFIYFFGSAAYIYFSGKTSAEVNLSAFNDHLEINSSFSLDKGQLVIEIPYGNINSIRPFPEIDCKIQKSHPWAPGTPGTGEWEGWVTYIATDSEKSSAIAVETTEGKYLIGCDYPVNVAKKLNELYASQIQKEEALKLADRIRKRFNGKKFKDSTTLIREDRER